MTKIRIPTVDFGYLEFEYPDLLPQDAIDKHNEILAQYKGGFGIETKDFNMALDRYLTDGTGNLEQYLKMSKEQQAVIQEIKKAFKRIKTKNGDNEPRQPRTN